LRVEWKDSKLKKEFVVPILVLSIPIFIGKFLFSIGKVFITIIAESHYSDDAISAFGVMSKIASVFGNVAMTFEEGQSSIISVNIGNKNLRRAVLSYPISVSISVGIGIIGIVVSTIFSSFFMGIFLKPEDSVEYVNMVYQLFLYERWSTITNAVIGITVSAFIGFKKSLMSTIINVLRIFILRIPVLLICIYAIKMDYHSLGVAMFVSNTLTAIIAVGCLLFYLLKIRKHGYNGIAYYPNLKAPLTEDSSIK
jgi:Na+-driven multidrug efflux pump